MRPVPVNNAPEDPEEIWKMLRLVKNDAIPQLREARFGIR
jgi:hypothetical protein